MTRLKTLLQLDDLHATFLKMNASGTIFVAALNGSALAIGAEFAWAPAEALALGAVDEVVSQDKVLELLSDPCTLVARCHSQMAYSSSTLSFS